MDSSLWSAGITPQFSGSASLCGPVIALSLHLWLSSIISSWFSAAREKLMIVRLLTHQRRTNTHQQKIHIWWEPDMFHLNHRCTHTYQHFFFNKPRPLYGFPPPKPHQSSPPSLHSFPVSPSYLIGVVTQSPFIRPALLYHPPPLSQALQSFCLFVLLPTSSRYSLALHRKKSRGQRSRACGEGLDKTEGGDRWVESESEKAKTKDSKQKIDSGCKWVLAKGESDRREQTRASLYWHVSVCLTPSLQWILSGHKCTTRWEFIKKKTFIIRN